MWGRLTVSLVAGLPGAQNFAVGMVEDVTARKQAEERMAFQATHDALTGLPNRSLFLYRVERCLTRAPSDPAPLRRPLPRPGPVQAINDSLGHAAGDRLLQAVRDRLRSASTARRVAHRRALGGDEFTLLLEDLRDPGELPAVAAMLDSIGLPYDVAGHEVVTTPSIGVVERDPGVPVGRDVLRDADAAMYPPSPAARTATPSSTRHARRRPSTGSGWRRTSAARSSAASSSSTTSRSSRSSRATPRVRGPGALDTPTAGSSRPAEFIPIAEDTGLIVPLGVWVSARPAASFASFHAAHPTPRPHDEREPVPPTDRRPRTSSPS